MKLTLLTTLAAVASLASAAPAEVIRRQASPSSSYAVSAGIATPTGTGALYPTGTASAAYPLGTGSACSPNGQLVCNGPSEFGICNWGRVTFQKVAAGMECKDGQVVAADS